MLISINIFLLIGFLTFQGGQTQGKQDKPNKKTPKEVSLSNVKKTLSYYILFESGKTVLNNEAKEKLDRVCKVFQNNLKDTLSIKTGSEKNSLYKERSIAVTNYLISKGVPQSQIRFVAYGKIKTAREIELILKE